jgi:hypothetical protein
MSARAQLSVSKVRTVLVCDFCSGSRLWENSYAEKARRISIAISSLRKLIALIGAAGGRQLRKQL